jgi:hypothetical protein
MEEEKTIPLSGLVDSAIEFTSLSTYADRVLQLPARIVWEISTIPHVVEDPLPLFVAVNDWALLYRIGEYLAVRGFSDKEQLSEFLAEIYRTAEIIAVLCKGRPVRFNMRVSARIG